MNVRAMSRAVCSVVVGLGLFLPDRSLANGGPFVIKYPGGDPAAKGILARVDPDLKPSREKRLRVVKEDLKITFTSGDGLRPVGGESSPLAMVSATYTIENPTANEIEVDFGFPILRGIYMSPLSMMPRPDVEVRLNGSKRVGVNVISNSAIYGLIRQRARDTIEKAIAANPQLAELVGTVRATGLVRHRARATIRSAIGNDAALRTAVGKDALLAGLMSDVADMRESDHVKARTELADYMTGTLKWDKHKTALMVEFASLDFGSVRTPVPDRRFRFFTAGSQFANANLGALGAIGEQKATQIFACLAECFSPGAAATYESIFTAWGGDVRQRSLDWRAGVVRPREFTVGKSKESQRATPPNPMRSDPTVYARVDYLDKNARITYAERDSCKTVLKNLPVIFTFAPMNLLHYRVKFPARQTQTLTVSYRQYAYKDTAAPATYQLTYVVHPASMWDHFGPIHLEVATPEGVPLRASVPCPRVGIEDRQLKLPLPGRSPARKAPLAIHRATMLQKTGELYLAVSADGWQQALAQQAESIRAKRQARR